MKKLLALLLAVACVLSLNVAAFAAAYDIYTDPVVGTILNGDGESAYDSGYDTLKPGDDYYYIIGPSSVAGYDILTDKDVVRFSMKKKTNGKLVSGADIVEKRFNGTRYVCIRFSIKDNFSADEYKVEMEAQIKARKDLIVTHYPSLGGRDFFPMFKLAGPSARSADLTPEQLGAAYEQAVKELAAAENRQKDLLNELKQLAADAGYAAFSPGSPVEKIPGADALKAEADRLQKVYEDLKAQYDAEQKTQSLTAEAEKLRQQLADLDAKIREVNDQIAALPTEQPADTSALQEALAALKQNISGLTGVLTGLGVDVDAALALGEGLTTGNLPRTQHPDALLNIFASENAKEDPEEKDTAGVNAILRGLQGEGSIFNDVPLIDDEGGNWAAVGGQLWTLAVDQAGRISSMQAQAAELQKQIDDAAPQAGNAAQRQALEGQLTTLNGDRAKLEARYQELTAANLSPLGAPVTIEQVNRAKADADAAKAKSDAAAKYGETYLLWAEQKNTVVPAAQKAKDEAYKAYFEGATQEERLQSGKTYYHAFKLYIQNENRVDDDATFTIGEKGVVIKPVKNERNIVTWENADGPVASMTFLADSDADYYCPRLSTRWNDADYLDYFHDVDAYLFDFVDNPRVPAATRPTLSLCNPFVDEDGDLTVRESRIHVYEVDGDGELIDKTHLFNFGENDDGDRVLSIRTFTLGTYIVSDGKADLPERKPSSRPADVEKPTIEVNNNRKPVPNTGR